MNLDLQQSMLAVLTQYRQCLCLRHERGPQYCRERVSDAYYYVDDVSCDCTLSAQRRPTDEERSGYVISQIPSQLICTRGKAFFSKVNNRIAVPLDTDVQHSSPLAVVSKLGVVLGHCDLCNCVGQDYPSAVRLPFFGMGTFGSCVVGVVRL